MNSIQFIQITPEKFRAEILQDFKREIDLLKKEYKPKEPVTFLTRNEVAEMLSVDLSTIHNWTKNGKLNAYSIGSRIYFKRDEVEQSLIQLKK